ncbi:MAG: GAF domain-containing protein [Chthoniobacteraceae bacterium]
MPVLFHNAPLPEQESARLRALRRYEILDTPAEKVFDDLLKLAAQICQTPIGLITFVDGNRQWFKSRIRFYTQEISRDISFCAHTILQDDVMEVPDARADERFSSSPMVIGGPAISYYAGTPLLTPDGHAIGTICVMDRVPRKLLPEQQESLKILAREVITHLELRVQAAEAASYMEESERSEMALRESEERFQRFMDYGPVVAYIKDEDGRFLYVNRRFEVEMGGKLEKIRGKTGEAFLPSEYRQAAACERPPGVAGKPSDGIHRNGARQKRRGEAMAFLQVSH